MNHNDLWEGLGELGEDEFEQVLTQLFAQYEERLKADPADQAAQQFFNYLAAVMGQVQSCNVNRR
ncbi:hypothetical protein [Desulfogranum mediterraneum]|uniref:hypothetical protein n=1 Tax=Desulfogranum mediterraneum TaxID=160661 RepID=UPI000424FA79|nr:hypothetical protein [Desulfogranum mediterraneum]